ncbi:MAG: hypothetical protein WC933_01785 [Candidatus Paceibacterota bacterium]|jgi:hypothetical protein
MKKIKNIIFAVSSILLSVSIILIFTSDFIYDYCIRDGHCLFWRNLGDSAFPFLLVYFSVPIFIFSLITYFLKDEIFKTWSKFTYVWVAISIILTLITPGGSGSFFVSLWDQQMTAIVMSGLFIFVSIIIVIFKVATSNKKC